MANICVTGIWHQGAVVAACFADLGNVVWGVSDANVATSLNSGQPVVHEPLLPEILQRNLAAGRLRFTTEYAEALANADFVFICTDTPVDANDESDLSSIYRVAEDVGAHLCREVVLCVTAQVPVGTTEDLAHVVGERSGGRLRGVAYVPEFLRLGIAVNTFRNADRIAIGADDPAVAERVAALYRPLGRPTVVTGVRSAEMAKHVSNAFLATSISCQRSVKTSHQRSK